MALTKVTKTEQPLLTPEDVARFYELKYEITKPLLDEMAGLEARLKAEIDPDQTIPLPNGYTVKRWEQIAGLKTAEFEAEKPISEFPELYTEVITDFDTVRDLLPREQYPNIWQDIPNPAEIKETLNDAEKKAYFNQSQYLKVTRVTS